MPTPDPNFKKPDPKVGVSQHTKKWLVAIGVVLVLVAVGLMAATWIVGEKTTETTKGPSTPTATEATTKTTKAKKGPAEGLLTALIGSGAALILVGFLYGRISSIKLPGGVDVGLTPKEEEKANEKVAEALQGKEADLATTAKVAQVTHNRLLKTKAGLGMPVVGGELPEHEIESAAKTVVDQFVE